MSISQSDFLRLLPAAVCHDPFTVDGAVIHHRSRGRSWRMVLHPLADRQLGLLRLPRLEVQIFLRGYAREQTDRFLERFELQFRRAGG